MDKYKPITGNDSRWLSGLGGIMGIIANIKASRRKKLIERFGDLVNDYNILSARNKVSASKYKTNSLLCKINNIADKIMHQ